MLTMKAPNSTKAFASIANATANATAAPATPLAPPPTHANASTFAWLVADSDAPAAQPTPAAYLSVWAIPAASLALLATWALSARLGLDLHLQLAASAARCLLQLHLLAMLLQPVLAAPSAPYVLACSLLMVLLAVAEALTRLHCTYQGIMRNAVASFLAAAALLLPPFLLVAEHEGPWWHPQYLIPLLAITAAQSMGSVLAALATVLSELANGQSAIESRLAHGASRVEATLPMAQAALSAALSPVLQQMSLAGLVALPGFMSGQLLASGDAMQAARHQVCVCFLTTGAAALASAAAVGLTIAHIVDGQHLYHAGRLKYRSREAGLFLWAQAQLLKAWQAAKALHARFRRACCMPVYLSSADSMLQQPLYPPVPHVGGPARQGLAAGRSQGGGWEVSGGGWGLVHAARRLQRALVARTWPDQHDGSESGYLLRQGSHTQQWLAANGSGGMTDLGDSDDLLGFSDAEGDALSVVGSPGYVGQQLSYGMSRRTTDV